MTLRFAAANVGRATAQGKTRHTRRSHALSSSLFYSLSVCCSRFSLTTYKSDKIKNKQIRVHTQKRPIYTVKVALDRSVTCSNSFFFHGDFSHCSYLHSRVHPRVFPNTQNFGSLTIDVYKSCSFFRKSDDTPLKRGCGSSNSGCHFICTLFLYH